MTTGIIDPRYGDASATPPPWAAVERLLDDWRFDVRGQEFVELSDSGAGTEGGAWVYRVAPDKVIAFGGPHGQTTYRFEPVPGDSCPPQ